MKDFQRFTRCLQLLQNIKTQKPNSIYECAKIEDKDVSNTRKTLLFLERLKVIRLDKQVLAGKQTLKPALPHDYIIFPTTSREHTSVLTLVIQ